MINEIPQYGLRAYSMFYLRHGIKEDFNQSELDWIVSQPMKKKIFSLLLNSGWIKKFSRYTYRCVNPKNIFTHLRFLNYYLFKLPNQHL